MRKARLIEIRDIPLDEIDAEDRLRRVSEVAVESLRASMEQLGVMMDEIHVRRVRHQGGKLKLMAGGHRLSTAKAMGWEVIRAKVWDCSDDWAQLLEIDDNLAHSELAPLELAVFLSRRKAIYERLYPEAKQGGARGNQHTGGRQTDIVSFCQSVAEKRDLTDRHIRRLVAAGDALSSEAVEQLEQTRRVTGRQVSLADLQALAKLGDPEQQRSAIWTFCNATSLPTLREAIAFKQQDAKVTEKSLKDPVEEGFNALMTAWKRAPKAAQRRFVEDAYREIAPLMPTPREGSE